MGGYTDEGTKTVIPSKASAKITCRLVGNQEPEIIIKNIHKFIRNKLPEGMKVNFKGFDYCKAIELIQTVSTSRQHPSQLKKNGELLLFILEEEDQSLLSKYLRVNLT